MDASKIPSVTQDENMLDFAAKYAPIILADEREPFTVVCAGYTVFEQEGLSPSFKPGHRVEWVSAGYPAVRAIEYALWWDWDIGHLYELEHAWTFIGADGQVVAVEASWHGMHSQMEIGGKPVLEGTHPVLMAQPGKHAMAVTVEPFNEICEWAEEEAGPKAGKDAVLETRLFTGRMPKTPQNDAKVVAYLKKLAFTPTWNFTKRFPVTREMLVPWQAMDEWIPARVAWWLDKI